MFKQNRKLLAFALFISLFVASSSVDVEPDKQAGEQLSDYPLPKTLEPQFYDVRINDINFEKSSFTGWVTITVTVKQDTKEVVLHCGKSLKCTFNTVIPKNGKKVEILNSERNKTTEKISASLSETLKEKSEVDVNLSFNGDLRDDMVGFYRSSYMDGKKEK